MPRGISRYRGAEKQTVLELDTRTQTALSADVDDYDLSIGACFNIGGSGADRTIKGIAGGREGRVIELVNVLGYNIFLLNEATTSIAGNRILTGLPSSASFQLAPNASIFLTYNNTVNRWVVIHGLVNFYPELDANLACLFRNRPAQRSASAMLFAGGGGNGQNKSESRATGGNQTVTTTGYTDVTSATTTFTLTKSNIVNLFCRASVYGEVSRNSGSPVYGLPGAWQAVLSLDLDGSTYVIGKQRNKIDANISGGNSLDILLGTGGCISGTEALLLTAGSHTAKLKMKKINSGDSSIVVENVADAPSVITAVW